MLVFRIEDEEGIGFYNSGGWAKCECTHDVNGPKCPDPSYDGLEESIGSHIFGFESMELLHDYHENMHIYHIRLVQRMVLGAL